MAASPSRRKGPIDETIEICKQREQVRRRAGPAHEALGEGRGEPPDEPPGAPRCARWERRAPRARSRSSPWRSSTSRSSRCRVDLLGMEGTLYHEGLRDAPTRQARLRETGDATFGFLRARANSIEGGTSEIMRNILGERVLGLPGEPRADKDRPWSEVPRN